VTATALDLITRALRLLQILAPGDVLNDDDAQDGLSTLNELVDGWATDGTTMLAVVRTQGNLVSGTSSYTIGSGGDFNIVRPVRIARASVIPDRTVADPIEIPFDHILTVAEYQAIQVKTLTARFPDRMSYDHAWSAGLGRITPWPVPNASVAALVLYCETALTAFADLSTSYTFAPGYVPALRYNLALELAADFEKVAKPIVVLKAREYLAKIQVANTRPVTLRCDPMYRGGSGRASNIYTGN
jgi:hypothetical protein